MGKLEKVLGVGATTVPLAEYIFYKNSAPNTTAARLLDSSYPLVYNSNLTPHVGNFPECFSVSLASGILGDSIENLGKRKGSKLLERGGRYFPEIVAGAISTYFALGETLLPQLLPGTADVRDIPVVFLSTLAGYTLAKLGRKSGFNRRIFSVLENSKP